MRCISVVLASLLWAAAIILVWLSPGVVKESYRPLTDFAFMLGVAGMLSVFGYLIASATEIWKEK